MFPNIETSLVLTIPVNWGSAHFLNLVVTDIKDCKNATFRCSSKHFSRFVMRANTYADEMKHGKGYAIMEKVAEEHNMPKFAPVTYAQQRYLEILRCSFH